MRATIIGELDRDVIIQDAATSLIHIQMFEVIHANQSIAKTLFCRGVHQSCCLVRLVAGDRGFDNGVLGLCANWDTVWLH